MMWHQILFRCHSTDICGTSWNHSLTSLACYLQRYLISLSFRLKLSVCGRCLWVVTSNLSPPQTVCQGDQKISPWVIFPRIFCFFFSLSLFLALSPLSLSVHTTIPVFSVSICRHPVGEVFVSRPMTGVVRMSISVIKILTERDLSTGTGRLEGVKFRFLHIHDLRL